MAHGSRSYRLKTQGSKPCIETNDFSVSVHRGCAIPVTVKPLLACTLAALFLVSCKKEETSPEPTPEKTAAGRGKIDPVPKPEAKPVAAPEPRKAPVPPKKAIAWKDKLLHAGIKHHNPNYTNQGQFQIEDGKVLAVMLPGMGITSLEGLPIKHLRQIDISDNPISDISPLKGAPLEVFYAERTKVEDLTPLRGAKLGAIALSFTPVHDISPLAGAPVEEVRLVSTRVADISALAGAPIQAAWFTDSPVNSIAALAKAPLITLTLHRTKVTDVSPLAGSQLQRLHIGETPVRDLRPLAGLPLTRLVFTPPYILEGMDVVRALPLREIGTAFDDERKDLVAPSRFWPAWDAVMAGGRPGTDPAPGQ